MILSKFQEENLEVKVYDTETKEHILTYPNYKKAGAKLNIDYRAVKRYCENKKRLYLCCLEKTVCFRIGKKIRNEDMEKTPSALEHKEQ